MTIAMAPQRAAKPADVGVSTRLSRTLLVAGLVGAHVAAITLVGIMLVARGPQAAASSAIAAAVVVAFFTIGHAVVIRFAETTGISVLVAALASYATRVSVLGVALAWYGSNTHLVALDPTAVSIGIIVTCVGWLAAEIFRFTRLRIPVYDVSTGGDR